MINKIGGNLSKIASLQQAMDHFVDGMTLMFGGFGGVGTPPTLIQSILEKGVRDLTLIGNDTSFPDIGIGRLICAGRVKKVIVSHIGSNPVAGQLMTEGKLEVEFSPQGTLAERIRAGGAGLGGILLDVGMGTMAEEGKPVVEAGGKKYLLETALTADVTIVHAKKADSYGNLIYDTSARNFNPLVAMAGDFTIAEADEIVDIGDLDPEQIVTPGVFVDMVIPSQGVNWTWMWQSKKGT